jgi:hypothetical protein
MKRTASIYTEYSPSKSNETYTVWVERNEGFWSSTDLQIAGTYDSFADAHQRQQEVAENYRILGYKVTEGSSS